MAWIDFFNRPLPQGRQRPKLRSKVGLRGNQGWMSPTLTPESKRVWFFGTEDSIHARENHPTGVPRSCEAWPCSFPPDYRNTAGKTSLSVAQKTQFTPVLFRTRLDRRSIGGKSPEKRVFDPISLSPCLPAGNFYISRLLPGRHSPTTRRDTMPRPKRKKRNER